VNFEGKGGKIAKTKKQRKGFEKKLLLTISKVNFEGKGGKIAKAKKKQQKGFEKSSFCQFPRSILKAKEEK